METRRLGTRKGYGSASQFSREYKGFFGNSAGKDIDRLREIGTSAVDAN